MVTTAPRPPKLNLGELVEGLLGDIGSEEFLEGMEFTELNLAEADATQATFLDCRMTNVNFGDADAGDS
ncbi:MAG: pentapeptide repeat-containing protein [Brevibacterium sp.]|uniref:pentapeptide repeat-containing protein n=1 Tax=Brevibacterium sp. TaxID=1701 RepID=UPI003F91162E